MQDNTDLIRIRDALDHLIKKYVSFKHALYLSPYFRYAVSLQRLAQFAEREIETVTVGRTHWQTASLTTVGKRATIWLQDLLVPFNEVCFYK